MLPSLREILWGAHTPYFIYGQQDGVSITDTRYGGAVTRASIALEFNHATSSYIQVASGVDRCQHDVYSSGLGAWVTNTRLVGEPQRTNSALYSSAINAANAGTWSGSSDFTQASVPSCIPGQIATKHTNLNAATNRSRLQTVGTFVNGQTDAWCVIIENDTINPALTCTISILDSTQVATVAAVTLTWATLVVAPYVVSPSAYGIWNLGIGPNGGQMVGLWITAPGTASGTGASGHARTGACYVTGVTQNGNASVVHHAQFEAASLFPSTPIVTGAATSTRSAEIVTIPIPVAATPESGLTIYAKYVDLGMSLAIGCPITIGALVSNMSAASYYSSVGHLTGLTQDSGGTSARTSAVAVGAYGDSNEVRLAIAFTGANTHGVAVNGGAETIAGPTAALPSWAGPWHDSTIHSNVTNASQGAMGLVKLILAAGAPSMDNFRGFI